MMDPLVLRYSHNIIEHLGLKLYQNRPTRVIAELVSNSWDADASRVDVRTAMGSGDRWVAVLDDGHGMNRTQLASSYLVVGHAKRGDPTERSPGGRYLMGRKGIGKLAAFGIAGQVDLVTSAAQDEGRSLHWLRFNLDDLLEGKHEEGSYLPDAIFEGERPEHLPLEEDDTGQVAAWRDVLDKEGSASGTAVIMTNLSIKRALNDDQLIGSMGKRFTVSVRDDFVIRVNGNLVTTKNGLPKTEYRIPEEGTVTEEVEGKAVSWWVGFVEHADWPADDAGVGVYAHGKIAQDRPFTFGVKGKEVFSRYMYAVVEADWLDELPSDLISTDRTNIDWTADETESLHEWGAQKVRTWIRKFEEWRRSRERGENRNRMKEQAAKGGPKISEAEQEQIVDLLSEITPALGKDSRAKNDAAKALSEAWLQRPMRKLVTELWAELGRDGQIPPEVFTKTVKRLSKASVPESLNLAVVFAQRVFALSRLHDYVVHGIEPDLQTLIERFPWIIEPDIAVLTGNQALRTAVEKAKRKGQIPTGRRSPIVGNVSEANRPDFVFLSSPEEKAIVVVELKSPQEDLTIDNRQQLSDYLTWFEAHYPLATLKGILVGRAPSALKAKREDIEIIPWTRVLDRSKTRNLELLSAMLISTAHEAEGDARVKAALELGGEDAEMLLERLAKDHGEIRDLMDEFPPTEE